LLCLSKCGEVRAVVQRQLASVNGAFKTLKELLDPPNAEDPARVDPEALDAIVEEFRTQRYDGQTRQLTLLVKNLSSFFDVVSNIVRMIQDFEVRPPAPSTACTSAPLMALLPHPARLHSQGISTKKRFTSKKVDKRRKHKISVWIACRSMRTDLQPIHTVLLQGHSFHDIKRTH
jgi:hypothetical protein